MRECSANYSNLTGKVKQAQTGLRVPVRPLSYEIPCLIENVNETDIEYEIHSLAGVKQSIAKVSEQVRLLEESNPSESFPDYPVVTFLGTGSTVSSKYRNVSGILLETHPGKKKKLNFLLHRLHWGSENRKHLAAVL